MLLTCILSLLAGGGVFMVGMSTLSDGLERCAGKGVKKLLGKIGSNRFAGVGIGAVVTGIIQSSMATTVMTIGFVNAGVMTLLQATAIVMGANIGTTVTGLLVSLSEFDLSVWLSAFAFVGVMMCFFKSDKIKKIGGILCGFGLLFIGLELMSSAFSNDEFKLFFIDIFSKVEFPILLVIIGMIFTVLVQSSSASTGLIIIMVGQGALTVSNALFIVLGSNIGTCFTAFLASIGTCRNAKRVSVIHLTFNILGTVLFGALVWIFNDFAVNLLASLTNSLQLQIALFHVVFNVLTTAVLLPFVKVLVDFSGKVIKEVPEENPEYKLTFVDKRLLITPQVALSQAKKELSKMLTVAKKNVALAVNCVLTGDTSAEKDIRFDEGLLDFTNVEMCKYFVDLADKLPKSDESKVASYFHVVNDLERVGDHAENFLEIAIEMKNNGLGFSPFAIEELKDMSAVVDEMFDLALKGFETGDVETLRQLTAKENLTDQAKETLTAGHFARLSSKDCVIELSAYFMSFVSGIERVADHLVNVGYSALNPTGSQSQARNQGLV